MVASQIIWSQGTCQRWNEVSTTINSGKSHRGRVRVKVRVRVRRVRVKVRRVKVRVRKGRVRIRVRRRYLLPGCRTSSHRQYNRHPL